MKNKELIKILSMIILTFLLTSSISVRSCTVIYTNDGIRVLAGANEDWSDPLTSFWIYPPSEGKLGWVKFGFDSGFPQAGMNETGLFWDATSGPWLDMPISEENKIKLEGPIMQKIITECSNIEEAGEILAQYYCEDQYKAQYLIGDSSGHSIIVEGDHIIYNDTGFQVLTNFYQSHPELGGYPCWRYEIAYNMLNQQDTCSLYSIGAVLDATHQEGTYPTQYSVIYDLKSAKAYLLYFHNYEEFIEIDLRNEIHGGERSYRIPALFSRIKMLSPQYASSTQNDKIELKWKGLVYSTYEVLISTDPNLQDAKSFWVHGLEKGGEKKLVLSYLFIPLLLVFSERLFKNRKLKLMLALMIVLLSFPYCSKKQDANPEPAKVKEFKHVVENLQPGERYFWKVKAYPEKESDFNSESVEFYFDVL